MTVMTGKGAAMTERLNAATLPLRGSRVIEASAGTGKTWTLAALVLRLVLGDGIERPLHPREILVMSFTRAATRELVERIRERLAMAARAFQQPDSTEAREEFVAALLQARPSPRERLEAAQRLRRAADAMDEAAVHTIDAWCQRVLREHAFDSGSRLSEEMLADESELRRQAVLDWWRAEVYPLQAGPLAQVLSVWKDVAAAEKSLGPLLKIGDAALPAGGDSLAAAASASAAQWQALKAGWPERCDRLQAWFAPLTQKGRSAFEGTRIRIDWLDRWLGKIREWAVHPTAEKLDIGKGSERLLPQEVRASFKPGQERELPPELDDFELLMAQLQVMEPLRATLLRSTRACAATPPGACVRSCKPATRWRWSTNARTARPCRCCCSSASGAWGTTSRGARCCSSAIRSSRSTASAGPICRASCAPAALPARACTAWTPTSAPRPNWWTRSTPCSRAPRAVAAKAPSASARKAACRCCRLSAWWHGAAPTASW
jgi:ATP-dependent exoDNAse (exonuclease V) beta subunit